MNKPAEITVQKKEQDLNLIDSNKINEKRNSQIIIKNTEEFEKVINKDYIEIIMDKPVIKNKRKPKNTEKINY